MEVAGYKFEVHPARDSAEKIDDGEYSPSELVAKMAFQKAADVASKVETGLVIGCDTVAECDGQILGKPLDKHHAQSMLRILRGREHRVFSGLCLLPTTGQKPMVRVAVTELRMDKLSDAELDAYLSSRQWEGKAGAFGYQDRTGWVHITHGSESNVVGLPLELLAEMLSKFNSDQWGMKGLV